MGLFFDILEGCEPKKYEAREAREAREAQEAQEAWNSARSRYSLSCRKCGELAYPVRYTTNHYECSCGNKFTGAKHPSSY